MLIQGSCETHDWCYFAHECTQRFLKRNKDKEWCKEEDFILLYDNARAHVSTFGAWYMR